LSHARVESIKEESINRITKDLNKYVRILKELVSYRSVTSWGLDEVRDCASYLSDLLKERGFKVSVKSYGGAPVVLAEVGSGSKSFIMYNHYDVQPTDPLDLWRSDPFNLDARDGLLVGRGVADNKGNIVARIAAVDSLLDYLDVLDLRVKFLIEGEEEVGSPTLAKVVEDNLSWIRADGGIWESAYVGRDGRLEIPLGLKGILYVELILRGPSRDVHSGYAPLIPNPAWRLARLLSKIKDENGVVLVPGFYEDVDPEFASAAEELIKGMEYGELEGMLKELELKEFVRSLKGVDALRELYMRPSLNISGLYSGYTGKGVKTIVPSTAGVKIDIRPVPGQDPRKLLESFKRYLIELGYSDVEVLVHSIYPSGYTKPSENVVKASVKAAREAYGQDPRLAPLTGGSGPIYLFTSIAKTPMTGAGVGYYGSKVHAPNENIRMNDLINGMKHVALTLIEFAQGAP